MALNNSIREKFLKIVLNELTQNISGSDKEVVYDERPSNTFFVESLCNSDENLSDNKKTVINPSTVGAQFLLSKKDLSRIELYIKPEGSVYYKIFPNFEEQLKYSKEYIKSLGKEIDNFEEFIKQIKPDEELRFSQMMRNKFKKINLEFKEIKVSLNSQISENNFYEEKIIELDDSIKNAYQIWEKDDNKYLSRKTPSKTKEKDTILKVPLSALKNEKEFDLFKKSWGEKAKLPSWKISLNYEIEEFDEENILISIYLKNNSTENSNDDVDNFIFNANIKIKVQNTIIQPYVLSSLTDNYKYDGNIWINGINCSCSLKENEIITNHLPIYEQKRLITQPFPKVKFEDLVSNPIQTLDLVAESMQKKLEEYKERTFKDSLNLTEIGKFKFDEEISGFTLELERFKEGINSIKKFEDVKEAFILMNETFKKSGEIKEYDSWRLFQIIFIVMNIPDIISIKYPIKNYLDKVDMLYFPTGGGKTESYLGLVVFLVFWDRLRGKFEGCSALTKFPLKLLSLQQLQRISNVFGQAELIRKKHPVMGKKPNKPFSLGFYVGGENTPNKLFERFGDVEINHLDRLEDEDDLKNKWTIISKCPFCGSKVDLIADKKNSRIIHKCSSKECFDGEEIPVYITDEEIYRYIPTFIVSTIDKIANVGQTRKFRNILGYEKRKCPEHGYVCGKKCFLSNVSFEDKCKIPFEEFEITENIDPTPSLLIQDELHLIRESFGSFDSHYETLIEYLIAKNSMNKKLKIIGATATMSDAYAEQIKQLYLRDAIRFPFGSPKKNESFYAKEKEDEFSRLILGLSAHNKSRIDTILDLIKIYREILQKYKNDLNKVISLGIGIENLEDAEKIVSEYYTFLSYHIRKSDGEAINTSIKTMVNPEFKKKNLEPINFASLTGDVDFSQVKEILKRLETGNSLDLITATKFISHGVDIDNFNAMVFQGMPRNNAEYIQALSRVGRKYPGFVIVAFNNTYERDKSYYQYFVKFHEFMDMLVEAVPLNRWAKFSIEPTLGGIFCGAILSYFDSKVFEKSLENQNGGEEIHMSNNFQKILGSPDYPELNENDIIDFVVESYGLNKCNNEHFEKEIKIKIKKIIDEIIHYNGKSTHIPQLLIKKGFKVMNSLRDIEKQIEITSYRDKDIIEKSRGVNISLDYNGWEEDN